MTGNAKCGTAAEIIQRDVIVIYAEDTLQDALSLMTENHVTGLPVMNAKGQCVGIITATDILNYEQEHADYSSEVNDTMAMHYDPDSGQWEQVRVSSFALEQFGEVRVEEVMARDLLSVRPDTPLKEVAKKMRNEKVHRVLVLKSDSKLLGIITSFDFVTLYAESD